MYKRSCLQVLPHRMRIKTEKKTCLFPPQMQQTRAFLRVYVFPRRMNLKKIDSCHGDEWGYRRVPIRGVRAR